MKSFKFSKKLIDFLLKNLDILLIEVNKKDLQVKSVLGNLNNVLGIKKINLKKEDSKIFDPIVNAVIRNILQKTRHNVCFIQYPSVIGKKIKVVWTKLGKSIWILCLDITKESNLIDELARKEAFLESIFKSIPQGIIILEASSLKVIKYKASLYTKEICSRMGIDEGISLYDTLPQEKLKLIKHNVDHVMMSGDYRIILITLDLDQSKKHIQLTFTKINNLNVLITINDITEIVELKEKYEYLSIHDPLTNLPNRRYVIEQVKQLVIQAKRHNRKLAILFIDIDNFKEINDSYSHEVGDRVLQNVAQIIKHSLRPGDIVGRFGGDEFIVVLDDVAKIEDIQIICKRLLENNYQIDEINIPVNISIGVAVYPDDSTSYEELIRFADIAMYKSKEKGKNSFEFYSNEIMFKLKNRLEMIAKISKAIEKEDFVPFYQPIIDIAKLNNLNNQEEIINEIIDNDLIIGLEALVRWFENGKLILPQDFIPLAEETNKIVKIGSIVVNKATKETNKFNKELFINVSTKEFDFPLYFENLIKILEKNHFPLNRLNIEITESLVMKNFESFINNSRKAIENGIKICIDDFGTGYSSFSKLINLPVKIIKIDRSFVSKIDQDIKLKKITETIIKISRILGCKVVAEGVERIQQLKILKKLGCDYAQGFLFFKPLPIEQIKKILAPAD